MTEGDISLKTAMAKFDILVEKINQDMNEFTRNTGMIIERIDIEPIMIQEIGKKDQFHSYKIDCKSNF